MKSKILAACLLASVSVVCSCSSEEPVQDSSSDGELVPVHFNLAFSSLEGSPTRSLAPGYTFSDGSSISVLKCYLYNKAHVGPVTPSKVVDIEVKDIGGHPGGTFTVLLPKGQEYDAVFLGTSIPQDSPASKLYYSPTERSLAVNYALSSTSDEELDCFYAVQGGVTAETSLDYSIILRRPFAQLNIGTQDYAEYNASTPVKNVSVTVEGVYSKFSLMDGSVVGDPVTAVFPASAVPSGQVFPVDGFSYLSMNYLLVNLRKLVNVTMTVNHTNGSVPSKAISIENVAVERNYQTNVYGKTLLTNTIE